jgi:hypothetical protein
MPRVAGVLREAACKNIAAVVHPYRPHQSLKMREAQAQLSWAHARVPARRARTYCRGSIATTSPRDCFFDARSCSPLPNVARSNSSVARAPSSATITAATTIVDARGAPGNPLMLINAMCLSVSQPWERAFTQIQAQQEHKHHPTRARTLQRLALSAKRGARISCAVQRAPK